MGYDSLETLQGYKSGTDPFEQFAEYTHSMVYPELLPVTYPLLIVLGVWRIMIVIFGAIMIVRPHFLSKELKREHPTLWIVRRVYINGNNSTPFYVPNHVVVFTTFESLTSLSFAVFTMMTYKAGKSIEFANKSNSEIWHALMWLPANIGLWLTGWGYCYVCICSPSEQTEDRYSFFLQPRVVNSLCVFFTLACTGISLLWAVQIMQNKQCVHVEYDKINSLLHFHSRQWKKNPLSYKPDFLVLQTKMIPLALCGERLMQTFRRTCLWWLAVAAFLFLFYLTTLTSLLRMMKRIMTSHAPKTPGICAFDVSQVAGLPEKKLSNLELERGYKILLHHCILIATGQVLCQGTAISLYFMCQHHSNVKYRTAAPFIEMVPTTFISSLVFLSTSRAIANRQKTPMASFSKLSQCASENNDMVQGRKKLQVLSAKAVSTCFTSSNNFGT